MATTLAISFPWGRYHATPWGHHVNEAAIELPPSSWRVLRALYATWKCRCPELAEETVRSMFLGLADAPTYVVPDFVEAHTRHYMPDRADGTDKVIDAFAVFERGAELAVVWPGDLDDEQRAALVALASQLPYLGRAEAICDTRVLKSSESLPAGNHFDPLSRDDTRDDIVRLLVPRLPLDLEALTASTTKVRKQRLLVPPGSRWQAYTRPVPVEPVRRTTRAPRSRPTTVRWSFATPARPSVHATVSTTDVLRRACMSQFGRLDDGGASPTLSGKQPDGSPMAGHRHAHYLALDVDGDQRIDTLALWAPTGLTEDEVAALASLRRLTGYGHVSDFRPGRLALEAVGDVDDVLPELIGPARVWRSSSPFVPARFPRRRRPWEAHVVEEIAQELRWRDLPAPVTVRLLRGSWLDFRRHRPSKQRLADARRAAGVELTFPDLISGPILLGALSHFGLGVFLPID